MHWKTLPKQTYLTENGQLGDCWRCCVAAILGVPAQSVPHFLELSEKDRSGPSMQSRTQDWLNKRGYWLVNVPGPIYFPRSWKLGHDELPPALISTGPTPRSKAMGQHHAVITINDAVVYDPHPSEVGLTAVTDRYIILPKIPRLDDPDQLDWMI